MSILPHITRRKFVAGAAVAGAVSTAAALSGCDPDNTEETSYKGEEQVVDDSQIVDVTKEYESTDSTLEAQATFSLPAGTIPFHSEGNWAALLMAPESVRSVNTLGILSLSSGTWNTLVEEPTQGSNYGFHDVRCSESVFAWLEVNYANNSWVLIAQPLSNGALSGDAIKLDEGTSDWEPAKFTTTGSTVIWLKMPTASGSQKTQPSQCLSWSVDDSESTELYESKGRFAGTPHVSDGLLTITPRVKTDEGTYYGLTALDLSNEGKVFDQMVMPQNVRPFEAVYMSSSFAFAVEANYGYGGSLGQMGSYIGREGGPFIALSREPLACIAGKGSRYFVKVRSSHVIIDTEAQTYSYLYAPDKTFDYGDYPASSGTTDKFVTYSSIRGDKGAVESVQVRVFSI